METATRPEDESDNPEAVRRCLNMLQDVRRAELSYWDMMDAFFLLVRAGVDIGKLCGKPQKAVWEALEAGQKDVKTAIWEWLKKCEGVWGYIDGVKTSMATG